MVAVLSDELATAKLYVKEKIGRAWEHYNSLSAKVQKEYEDRAKTEKEMAEAAVQLALVPLFFFGAGMAGEAAKAAGAYLRPILSALPAARIDKIAGAKFRQEVAVEVVREALKLTRVAVSKVVTTAGTVMETMVLYTQTFHDNLPNAHDALAKCVEDARDIEGIAAILAAVTAMTPDKFDAEYRAETKKFETQVAPTFQMGTSVPDLTGAGATILETLDAHVKVGSKTYRAQVRRTTMPGTLFNSHVKPMYDFVCWIEFPVDVARPGGAPVELTPDQLRLPSEAPPDTALIGS